MFFDIKPCNVKVNYNSILNEYTLVIPIKHILNAEKEMRSNNIIVLDPGLRTFAKNKLKIINNILCLNRHKILFIILSLFLSSKKILIKIIINI
jgi:hypothetical protein